MRKKKQAPDPASEVIQDAIIVQGKTIPVGRSEPAPVAPSTEVTKVVKPVWAGPRWDYKFLRAIGYLNDQWERDFDALGADGWEFCGTDSHGRSVFKRPL